MPKNANLPLKTRGVAMLIAAAQGRTAQLPGQWRRSSHGSTRFASDPSMRQPQDGAMTPGEMQRRVASIASRQPAIAQEPEDARLTGLTRSLYRRLMGLNVMDIPTPVRPVTSAVASVVRKQPVTVSTALAQRAQVA